MDFTETIWPDWTPNKRRAQFYALRCMGHRMRKFGFEPVINRLDARSLLCLGIIAHEPMASACQAEAIKMDPAVEDIIKQIKGVAV